MGADQNEPKIETEIFIVIFGNIDENESWQPAAINLRKVAGVYSTIARNVEQHHPLIMRSSRWELVSRDNPPIY